MTENKLPDQVNVDFDELTLGDLEDIEDMIGEEATRKALAGSPGPKALKALVYIELRKTNPDITVEDVRGMKLKALTVDEPNPTEAGA